MHAAAAEEELEVVLEVDAFCEGTAVVSDPGRIEQILANFAWNAIKFSHAQSGAITLRVKAPPSRAPPPKTPSP